VVNDFEHILDVLVGTGVFHHCKIGPAIIAFPAVLECGRTKSPYKFLVEVSSYPGVQRNFEKG